MDKVKKDKPSDPEMGEETEAELVAEAILRRTVYGRPVRWFQADRIFSNASEYAINLQEPMENGHRFLRVVVSDTVLDAAIAAKLNSRPIPTPETTKFEPAPHDPEFKPGDMRRVYRVNPTGDGPERDLKWLAKHKLIQWIDSVDSPVIQVFAPMFNNPSFQGVRVHFLNGTEISTARKDPLKPGSKNFVTTYPPNPLTSLLSWVEKQAFQKVIVGSTLPIFKGQGEISNTAYVMFDDGSQLEVTTRLIEPERESDAKPKVADPVGEILEWIGNQIVQTDVAFASVPTPDDEGMFARTAYVKFKNGSQLRIVSELMEPDPKPKAADAKPADKINPADWMRGAMTVEEVRNRILHGDEPAVAAGFRFDKEADVQTGLRKMKGFVHAAIDRPGHEILRINVSDLSLCEKNSKGVFARIIYSDGWFTEVSSKPG